MRLLTTTVASLILQFMLAATANSNPLVSFTQLNFNYVDTTFSTSHQVVCYEPDFCNGECPLYVWVDGTDFNEIYQVPDLDLLFEMSQRGFVSCVAQYDDGATDYSDGCPGFRQRAKDIFDPQLSTSLTNFICGNYANCDLGVATHGWSQGAHIAALASEFITVTGSLLWGNGNKNTLRVLWFTITTDVSCMNENEIGATLPKEIRRSIAGEFDAYFYNPSVLQQQKDTSGYDCGGNFDCLDIANDAGGFYVVAGEDHGFYILETGDTAAPYDWEPAFLDDSNVWGMTQSLDWLARTACPACSTAVTAAPTAPTSTPSNMPSAEPSSVPSEAPTNGPTMAPSSTPSSVPSSSPTLQPSTTPSSSPSKSTEPTPAPVDTPTTAQPTTGPTSQPSDSPSGAPSNRPTMTPSSVPSSMPSNSPTSPPSATPSSSPSSPVTPSPVEAASWQQIWFDDFENGWGNWIDGGSDVRLSDIDSAYAHSGIFTVQLRDNSGTASSMISATYTDGIYNQFRISFWYRVVSFEGDEDFFVELSQNGGSTWGSTPLARFVNVVDFVDDGREYFVDNIETPILASTNNIKFRIRCDASTNGDVLYIDDVKVEGRLVL